MAAAAPGAPSSGTTVPAPQHPTYDIQEVRWRVARRACGGSTLAAGAASVAQHTPSPRAARPSASRLRPQVIRLALAEDAGDLGDITTNATCGRGGAAPH